MTQNNSSLNPNDFETSKFDGTTLMCCPLTNTFSIIGKKFSILIIHNMMAFKQTRFNQFLHSIMGINPKTLSIRLKEMEEDGLIERNIVKTTPILIEYSLTKKGWALKKVISAMAEFSMTQCANNIFADKNPRKFKDVKHDHPLLVFKL